MIRYGTVLVFREGVTKEQAAEALLRLQNVVDFGGTVWNPEYGNPRYKTPFDFIEEFDDKQGGPVWYIP